MKDTMQAVVCPRYGGPQVLEVKEIARPVMKDSDVLVRVHATAVNSGDARSRALAVSGVMRLMMRLALGWKGPRRPVLGTVYAGVVEAVGSKAMGFKPGDEVWGCTPGMAFGAHAEYVAVPAASAIAQKPEGTTFEQAAALLFGGTTALFFLDRAKARSGQSVLVYGASGAVGTMAVQIARNLGQNVTAVASGPNEQLVRGLGAQAFLDYTGPGFALPQGQYDIVFDAVGKLDKGLAAPALKPGGAYITVGGTTVAKETKEQLAQLAQWVREGRLTAVIDGTWPLPQAAQAHAHVDTGRKRGSAVLRVRV